MKKLIVGMMTAALLLSGCNVKVIKAPETGTVTEVNPTPDVPRVDTKGEPIKTGYAEGAFVKAEAGLLHLEAEGKTREFVMTKRAEQDLSVLELKAGDRMIVNIGTLEDGRETAESLEKIIAE